LNKIDASSSEVVQDIDTRLRDAGWEGPVFTISAQTGEGCQPLMWAIQNWIEEQRASEDVVD